MQAGQTKNGIGMTLSACLWLGLFPLMQFGTFSSITRDKWICMYILTGVSLLCFLVDLCCRRLSRPRVFPLVTGALLLGWMTLSAFTSPYPGNPWWIGAGRREGLATQLAYYGLFFLFCCSRVRRGPVLFSAVAGLAVFTAVVVLQRAGKNPFGLYPGGHSFATAPGFQGTIGNVDVCSTYLLIVAGLAFPALVDALRRVFRPSPAEPEVPLSGPEDPRPAPKRKSRLLPLLAAAVLLLVLVVCAWLFYTMEVRFGLLTLAVLLVWTLVRFLPKKLWFPVLLLLMVLALALVWYYPFSSVSTLNELHEILHGHIDYNYGTERVGVWIYCAKLLSGGDHLLLGTGPDTFALRFNEFLNAYLKAHPDAPQLRYYYDSPHNEYIALLLNCGIPALLLFLVLVIGGCFGRPAWRDSVFAYGIQALLSLSVCLVSPMFWVVNGMAWSMAPPGPQRPEKAEAAAS